MCTFPRWAWSNCEMEAVGRLWEDEAELAGSVRETGNVEGGGAEGSSKERKIIS